MGVNPEPRPLALLLGALGQEVIGGSNPADATVRNIVEDSRKAQPGSLFVAIGGRDVDGHAFAADAVRRGAVGIVAEREIPGISVPVIGVRDSRRALAILAADWFGHPAKGLELVGVTGTVGKTSVIAMLEAILTRAGRRPGVIGSLGSGWGDDKVTSGMTTPGALDVQEALARIAQHTDIALVEVTSHALVQERVHGLTFELGIFTNLVMLEHLEFHDSFQGYVKAKTRFFEHLEPDAPLIYPAGDRLIGSLIADRPVRPVPCGSGSDVALHIERTAMTSHGTRLLFQIEKPFPRMDGGTVAPMTFAAALKLLGRPAINNASLAAAAALSLGVDSSTTAHALAELEPLPRRMQVMRPGEVTLLDDTVGHPDSITGVFEVAEVVPHERMFVVYAIRGRRGADINQRDAEAVAIWTRRIPVEQIAVTAAVEATDAANEVSPEEREAFLEGLGESAAPHSFHDRLDDAIASILPRARPSDLVLLLGAQGMNQGTQTALRLLGKA